MSEPTALLLLPRLQIQNANAISGPLSWGFPAPTAFTGFVHALERRFSNELPEGFGGVGIICHRFEPQVFQPSGKRTQVFRLTRNPSSELEGGQPKPASIVEEGRAHLEISLVIAVRDYMTESNGNYFAEDVLKAVQGMRLAGGSIPPIRNGKRFAAQWLPFPEDAESQAKEFRILCRRLLPGFALVQREDALLNRLTELQVLNAETNALDALLDMSRLNIEPDVSSADSEGKYSWNVARKKSGWLVPIPVGYGALSPLYNPGEVQNTRDNTTPFRFVESLYSLGEWVGPHRLTKLKQLLWHTQEDVENGIYRCINYYSDVSKTASSGIV